MNKKLAAIFLTVLLLLIGKSQAVTLTQALGDNYIYVEVDSGQQITLNFNNNANYTFTKWTVESGNVTIDTTNPIITFAMPSTDVVIRGNYAEATASEYSCECEVCEEPVDTEGDYCDNCIMLDCCGCSCERPAFCEICYRCNECSMLDNNGFYDECNHCGFCCECETECNNCGSTYYRRDLCYSCGDGYCSDCCTCGETECGGCNEVWPSDEFCSDCGYCPYCCVHICSACDFECVRSEFCFDCGRCISCCSCGEEYECACDYCSEPVDDEEAKCDNCWGECPNYFWCSCQYIHCRTCGECEVCLEFCYECNYCENDCICDRQSLADIATVGAYVTYVPSNTDYTVPTTVSGYTSDQTFDPSSAISWRIFSKDEDNIEIISTDSVGNLTLEGTTGYINAVQTLNDLSMAYVNPQYAVSGRSLGYNEDGLTDVANYKVINTTTYPLNYNVSGFPYTDSQYSTDQTVLLNHGSMYHSSDYVWLASRSARTILPTDFFVYCLNTTGTISNIGDLYTVYSYGSTNTDASSGGVRPIVTLESGITVTGGTGTKSDPYIINTKNASSRYTVAFCANGGYGEIAPGLDRYEGVWIDENPNIGHHSKIFLGWATSPTATLPEYFNGDLASFYSGTLYAVWVTPLSSGASLTEAHVGAYVEYIPSTTSYTVSTTASGYTSNQTYYPSSDSWRVFNTDGENVEIISANSIGTLNLRGATGYINAVKTLNDISAAYVNSTYAESGRSLGYYDKTRYTSSTNSSSAMTETELANYKTIDTTAYPLIEGVSGFPYADYQYEPDVTIMENNNLLLSTDVWLASRDETFGYWLKVRYYNEYGYDSSEILYYSDDGEERNVSNGVCPVITLKSGITVTGGKGTESDPYTITIQ